MKAIFTVELGLDADLLELRGRRRGLSREAAIAECVSLVEGRLADGVRWIDGVARAPIQVGSRMAASTQTQDQARRAQTIVRKVRGSALDDERFLIFHEVVVKGRFKFIPTGRELTLREVAQALLAQGFSEDDVFGMINEAAAAFGAP